MSYPKKEPVGDYILLSADYYLIARAKEEEAKLEKIDSVLPEDCDIIKD